MAKISINLVSGNIQKEDPIVGIDLGTTNSLVAIIDKKTGKPMALKGRNRSVIVPSLIHFGDQGEMVVGESARQFLTEAPGRTLYSIKRLMGKSYQDLNKHQEYFGYRIVDDQSEGLVKINVDNRYYSPIELSSYILKELKYQAEQELGQEVKRAVITVPAYFNDSQRQATRDAGKLAGLEVLRIINEPTAASLAYGIGLDKEETKHVAIFDLGGGTFDVSILRITQGIFEVLATHGDTYLGGDDFDRAIIQYWQNQHNIANLSKEEMQALRLIAEEAKKQLGENEAFSGRYLLQGKEYELVINRNQFSELSLDLLNKTAESCKRALKDSGLQLAELDEVVLVGGSTRTFGVKKFVSEIFQGIAIHDEINPDEVVALGAAVEADILAGNRKDLLLLDVTPLSLGIETLGGLMDVIIPRNSKVPSRVAKEYSTSVDGQVNLKINVFQGERELVAQNRKLAEFVLSGIPAMPAGFPKIKVTFSLDADGILTVEAMEERSGVAQDIQVKPQYGLTDDQVETMLMESIQYAQSDMNTRMLLEAQNEAKQIIYLTERFIEKNESLLSDDEIQKSMLLVNDLRNSLENSDKDTLLSLIDELNDWTRPFAERLMDIGISNALKGKSLES